MNSFQEIWESIQKYDSFYLCGHKNPDGDSIGSCECLGFALKQLGKQVVDSNAQCFIQMDVQADYRLDANSLSAKQNAKFKICFDHHQVEQSNCDLAYVDPSAAANALIMWDFVNYIDIEITKDIASAAYFGLCSDTNSFTNTNSDVRAFNAAAQMMSYGVNAGEIAKKLFQSRSLASFNLEKIVLDNMYVNKEQKFVLSYLSANDYEENNATKDDSDALIDLLRKLECVEVACLIRQEKNGEKIKGSLRSKDQTDVSLLAKQHLGGGHKAAAGFTMETTCLEDAIVIIKQQLKDLMQGTI